MFRKFATICMFSILTAAAANPDQTHLVSGVLKIEQPGDIHIGVYSQADYAAHKDRTPSPPFFQIIAATPEQVQTRRVPFRFEGIPKGRYCIIAFQDTNDNGKIDRFVAGGVAEPRGWYKEPEFGWASWADISFLVDGDVTGIEILLSVRRE